MKRYLQLYREIFPSLIAMLIVVSPLILSSNIKDFTATSFNLFSFIFKFFSSSGIGYELPKVSFILWGAILISIAYIVPAILYNLKSLNPLALNKSTIITGLLVASLLATIIFLPELYRQTAINGNSFRDQGVIFYFTLIVFGYLTFSLFTKDKATLIAKSFILGCAIQAIIAFNQVYYFFQNNQNELFGKGLYINGSFGQSNFFSGYIIIGLFFSIYFFIKSKISGKVLYFILIVLSLIPLIFSLSYWGIISASLGALLLIFYEVFVRFKKPKAFTASLCVLTVVTVILFIFLFRYTAEIEFLEGFKLRPEIWDSILKIFLGGAIPIGNFIFGYGFDTLRLVFVDFGFLSLNRVDRAHNVFLDVLSQNGVLGIIIFFTFIAYIFQNIQKLFYSKITIYFSLITLLWIFRSVVNESGVVNILQFIILIAITLKLQSHPFDRIDT